MLISYLVTQVTGLQENLGSAHRKPETVCGGQVLVAQLAERLTEDQEALGSIPSGNTHPPHVGVSSSSPIGRGGGLKICTVWVRVPRGARGAAHSVECRTPVLGGWLSGLKRQS